MQSIKGQGEIDEPLVEIKLLLSGLLLNFSGCEYHLCCTSINPKATLLVWQNVSCNMVQESLQKYPCKDFANNQQQ